MSKRTARPGDGQSFQLLAGREEALHLIHEELRQRMRTSVLGLVDKLFEEEVRELCGEPWSRKPEGAPHRGGTERGSIYLEGRRVRLGYPRVVDAGGSHALESYRALGSYDLMAREVQTKLLRGVSTRDYADVVSQIVEGTGLKRSTVSAAFARASRKSLEEINGRDLSKHLFVALFVDGIEFAGTILIVGMGMTTEGQKVLLGLREGGTENATVVGELLENLIERKITLSDRFLAVIDGSKALRSAILKRWQGRVEIQRCQVHKRRNVLEQLPPSHQADARRRMNAAYGLKDVGEAKKMLENTIRWLEGISEPAARSLEEGLDETLTVVKLGLPDLLRRTLATTNPIESILDGVRYRTGRVKRWRTGKGEMISRWTASALLLVEKRLHRVKGHKLMPMLLQALKRESVDEAKKVG